MVNYLRFYQTRNPNFDFPKVKVSYLDKPFPQLALQQTQVRRIQEQ